jgi:hypothetical protein
MLARIADGGRLRERLPQAYFGALRHDLAAKGAYTAEVRRLFH